MKITHILYFSLVFSLSIVVLSCNTATADKSELLNAIADSEKLLYGDKSAINFDAKIAEALTTKYNAFAKAFPADAKTPNYLFKSAEVLRSLRKFNEAAGIYKKIGSDFPEFEKAPHSLFLLGFSYENDLKNLKGAKYCYNEFLQKYPKHELADDVTFSLKNLGKSPDEIIKSFEEKRK